MTQEAFEAAFVAEIVEVPAKYCRDELARITRTARSCSGESWL
jgi:hypothetical protein